MSKYRVNEALIFLNKISFVNWSIGGSEIEFFHTKGSRVGDIFDYFAKMWVKIEKLKPKKKISPKQKGLEEFLNR